jgi:Fe-S-cluster containining protein
MRTKRGKTPPPNDEPAARNAAETSGLARQLERGALFTHTAFGQSFTQVRELEAFVFGLLDVLIKKRVVASSDIEQAVDKARDELTAREPIPGGVALRVDAPGRRPRVAKVNCAERLHICHAVCCKLDFALSQPEVESGKIKWDLGRPYFIRHEATGYCAHNDPAHGCTVYADRPTTCRVYSCAGDTRIWADFDKMELNQEWLDANLGEDRPRLTGASMQPHATVRKQRGVDRKSEQ